MNSNQSDKPYRKGVNAIVIDKDNNFLLVQKCKYKDNEWNVLGGGRDEGETREQNLFRELNEEIGAEKDDFKIIGASNYQIKYDYPADTASKIHGGKYRGQSYEQIVLRFVGSKDNLKFNPEEFKKHKWVKLDRLKEHLIFPSQYSDHKKAIVEFLPNIFK